MGCSSSTVSLADQTALGSAEFTGIPLVWSGITADAGTLVGTGKTLEGAGGTVLLSVDDTSKQDKVTLSLSELATGKVVLLVYDSQAASFFNGTPTIWTLYTAVSQAGQKPETTPTGSSMYRLGTFEEKAGVLRYLDANGATVMTAKHLAGFSTCKAFGADGLLAAVVLKLSESKAEAGLCTGMCTYAKGVDPVMVLAMATASASVAQRS
jgi:hypothetical protein